MPSELMYFLVSGDMGYVEGPSPNIRRSVTGPNQHFASAQEMRSQLTYTRFRPHQIQNPPSLLLHIPLPLSVYHSSLLRTSSSPTCLPRSPTKSFPGHKNAPAAAANLESIVQMKSVVQTGVNTRRRCRRVTQHVHCSEVCLGFFFGCRPPICGSWDGRGKVRMDSGEVAGSVQCCYDPFGTWMEDMTRWSMSAGTGWRADCS